MVGVRVGVRRRAPVVRQWSGGRHGPNSGEWRGGASQGASARARLGPWESSTVVKRSSDRVQGSLGDDSSNGGQRHSWHARGSVSAAFIERGGGRRGFFTSPRRHSVRGTGSGTVGALGGGPMQCDREEGGRRGRGRVAPRHAMGSEEAGVGTWSARSRVPSGRSGTSSSGPQGRGAEGAGAGRAASRACVIAP
jgi:hypothetical protein